jgi:hypothetical protein
MLYYTKIYWQIIKDLRLLIKMKVYGIIIYTIHKDNIYIILHNDAQNDCVPFLNYTENLSKQSSMRDFIHKVSENKLTIDEKIMFDCVSAEKENKYYLGLSFVPDAINCIKSHKLSNIKYIKFQDICKTEFIPFTKTFIVHYWQSLYDLSKKINKRNKILFKNKYKENDIYNFYEVNSTNPYEKTPLLTPRRTSMI